MAQALGVGKVLDREGKKPERLRVRREKEAAPMGPYRQNTSSLRARREELRLELDDIEARMTDLTVARHCIDEAIDDIDLRLQIEPRPRGPEGRRRRLALPIIVGAAAVSAVLLTVGVATAPRMQPNCIQASEKQTIIFLPAPKLNP